MTVLSPEEIFFDPSRGILTGQPLPPEMPANSNTSAPNVRMRMEGTLDPSRGTRRPDDIKRQPGPTEMPMPPAPIPTQVYELPQDIQLPSDATELQKLRAEYDRLSNIRFVQDPGPEFGAKLQALAGQISQLDPEFKNPYAIGGDLGAGPRRPDEGLDLDELLNRQLNIRQMPPGRGTVFRGTPDEGYSYGVGEGVPGTSDGLPGPPQMPTSSTSETTKASAYTGLPLYEKDITGVEAARRFKEYAEANNIELDDKGVPIFSSKDQKDAAYAAGYRGTGKIKLSEADIENSRKRQEEEARRPVGDLKSDMLEQLFASGVMDPDRLKRKLINDDFFLDRTGIFGEKGKKYNIQLPKDQINFAHTRFTNLQDLTPPPAPPKTEGRYVPPTSNLGTPDSLIPSNIVGQSYDPGFAARFLAGGTGETNVDAGNGMGMMVMPQRPEPPAGSVFGGYGQQAPMQALAPYAGMAQSNPQPTDFFPSYVPRPDPIFEEVPAPGTQPNAQPVMGSGG